MYYNCIICIHVLFIELRKINISKVHRIVELNNYVNIDLKLTKRKYDDMKLVLTLLNSNLYVVF